jgi:hypothetical protein
VAGLGRRVFT